MAQFFIERGVPVIDADQLARDAVLPGSAALKTITSIFGCEVLTPEGELDRKLLGAQIFTNPVKRHQLVDILHPVIRKLAEERISLAEAAGHQRLIYMAPLLIEAGAIDRVDTVWVVTVRPKVQLERLMRRDSINQEQALHIINSQMPLAEKERYGSVIIDNSGSKVDTYNALETVWAKEMESGNE